MKNIMTCALASVLALGISTAALADGHSTSWTLDGDTSRVAFGSIKKDTVGEIHSFESISGMVGADGTVKIDIDLTSVETYIDIRNERMGEHVFKNATTATLTGKIEMEELSGLGVGETSLVDIEGTLSLVGTDIGIDAEMFVARIADGKVLVTTNDMIFLSAEDAGINAGITKLMELAKLPGITRTSPVTLRLVFDADAQKAELAPAAQ